MLWAGEAIKMKNISAADRGIRLHGCLLINEQLAGSNYF